MADKKFFKYLNDNETERLRFHVITKKGKVVDVVIQYETLLNGKWLALVRYDCAHGFFHRDVMRPDGKQEKMAIAIEELEVALGYAEQDLKDKWEIYKQNYLKYKNDK